MGEKKFDYIFEILEGLCRSGSFKHHDNTLADNWTDLLFYRNVFLFVVLQELKLKAITFKGNVTVIYYQETRTPWAV